MFKGHNNVSIYNTHFTQQKQQNCRYVVSWYHDRDMEDNMNMWQDPTQITATFRGKKMDDKEKVRSAVNWHRGQGWIITYGRPRSPDRREDIEKVGSQNRWIVSHLWLRGDGGVTENCRCEREEEEEEEGDAGLRENVYRLWFINSWAVSKSSRRSESLWIEARRGGGGDWNVINVPDGSSGLY